MTLIRIGHLLYTLNSLPNVYVIGAGGFISPETVKALRRLNHRLHGLAGIPAKAEELAKNEVSPVDSTPDDPNGLRVVDEENIDVILSFS